ncbi:MAG: 50S ribosomal protein L17 [Candidatus Edwardsbacteria bacterium]|nr:50S ribosomal protein L17 [Candidatus Edwardsbacteria bacterium]MBU1576727.1 50S ribosomal protein L17 [Candidatus Edwardsbacteria bacterium]MBU2464511.1 50S ribosomal protein L17 [Candidatus Edwardsbacteria bacterium]MBU2594806.1 50S ribosomal protein L17 [Candidatus Edwardsbacteria bacterium]
MRHRKDTVKLGRTRSHRAALVSNMVTSLFKYERIKTTITKAMVIRRDAEHMISIAQKGTLAARRQVATVVKDQTVLRKLFDVIVPRMKDKKSGFISIVKLWPRHGDAALLAQMELFGAPAKVKPEEAEKKAKAAPKKKAEKKEEGEKKEKAPKAKKEKPEKKAAKKEAKKAE